MDTTRNTQRTYLGTIYGPESIPTELNHSSSTPANIFSSFDPSSLNSINQSSQRWDDVEEIKALPSESHTDCNRKGYNAFFPQVDSKKRFNNDEQNPQ